MKFLPFVMAAFIVIAPLATSADLLSSYLDDEADGHVLVDVVLPPKLQKQNTGWFSKLRHFLGARRAAIRPEPGTVFTVQSSGYASSPYQTDSTPCITSSGTRVRSGVVASNFLPAGTLLDINGQVYIVEDRMNARYKGYFIDIWFPSTSRALEFGRRNLEVTIIGYGQPGQAIREAQADIEPIPAWQQLTTGLRTASLLSRFLGARDISSADRFDVDCFKDDKDATE